MKTKNTISEALAVAGVREVVYNGEAWVAYEVGDTLPPRDTSSVPPEVTMRQARLALLGAGLLATVETKINELTEPTKTAARIEWEYSQTVQRHKGLVATLAGMMGLTDAQLDTLFVTAATL